MLKPISSAFIVGVAIVAFSPFSPASCNADRNSSISSDVTPTGTQHQSAAPDSSQSISAPMHKWEENATWVFYNGKLKLTWEKAGGDWTDARGVAHGEMPFAATSVIDDDKPGVVDIDVSRYYALTGRSDFFIRRSGGTNFVFYSREASAQGPQLILDGGLVLYPVADTSLSNGTVSSLGNEQKLATQDGFLIRFDIPVDRRPSKLILRLTSTGAEYGNQTLGVFQPGSPSKTVDRPAWLKRNSKIIASIDGSAMNIQGRAEVANSIATKELHEPELTWMSKHVPIPERTEACATVYHKLHRDFQPGSGGKLPGFANTGNAYPGSDSVNGVTYPDSGWGGRPPDGIHWSARTGYGTWTANHVAVLTYFYAMEPHDAWGWGDPINWPNPKGSWTAYVQCVKLNTISSNSTAGNKDGGLYYEIPGIGPVYSRNDIRWRDLDIPQSRIREFWVDYYCGGTSCGKGKHGTVSFARAVVTEGLPDMDEINAEVKRLNSLHH